MATPERRTFREIVPRNWLESYDHAWMTIYSIAMGSKQEFLSAKKIDLPDAIIIAFWGSLTYLDPSGLVLRFSPDGVLITEGKAEQRDTGEGAWLVVVQPCNTNSPRNEYSLRVKASVLASLLISVTTRNYAFSEIAENCISLTIDESSAAGPPILGPHGYDRPLRSGMDNFETAAALLAAKPQPDRRRIELSLHWYDKSQRSMGVDGFLNNWIAIETLAMPDTSNVRPINERLQKIYGIPYSEVKSTFCVGKLLGLRSRIVHDGQDLIVHSHMTDYMNRLYEDLLHSHLGLVSQKLGEVALAPGFKFDKLLGAP